MGSANKEQADLIQAYFTNMRYKYKAISWNQQDYGWTRVHGDLKSKTGAKITTWVMKGNDGKYHYSLQHTRTGNSKKYNAKHSIFRGSFDKPFTSVELMSELRKLAAEKYGREI